MFSAPWRALTSKLHRSSLDSDVTHMKQEEEEKLTLDDDILLDEDSEAGYEAEEDEEDEEELEAEDEEEEEGEEEEVKESTKMKILRHMAEVATKVKEIIGNLITTAGKVVVTILLGMTGEQLLPHQLIY